MSQLIAPRCRDSCLRILHAHWTFRPARSLSNTAVSANISVREALRTLLQHTAQPVSVLTVKCRSVDEPYRGATLSSFSSIAFHPLPIVSFALQLPSRSADALQAHLPNSSMLHEVDNDKPIPNLVINILSSSQSCTAIRFSRPELHPKPFSDPDIPYTLTQEGVPILGGSLGALSCSLLASLPIHGATDWTKLAMATKDQASWSAENGWPSPSSSVLYLARVLHIEKLGHTGSAPDADGKEIGGRSHSAWPLPLIYHRRSYGTVKPLDQA
jgi:flavin reductase (DIM6/NTAB) family NADH-FMN oxidoreductase RutF